MKHYLGICLVLVTLAAIGFFAIHSCTSAVGRTANEIADAFSKVLHVQPQVTMNQRVILSQTAPIAELAVVTKDELVTLGFNEHYELLSIQVPLTEKKLSAEAVFRIKAGFDLREPFSVEIDPATHDLHATMPHAKILSVEQTGPLNFQGEDSSLNRLTDAEREKVVNDLNSAARDTAEKSTLKKEAEDQVEQRLKELIQHNGQRLELKWSSAPVSPS